MVGIRIDGPHISLLLTLHILRAELNIYIYTYDKRSRTFILLVSLGEHLFSYLLVMIVVQNIQALGKFFVSCLRWRRSQLYSFDQRRHSLSAYSVLEFHGVA